MMKLILLAIVASVNLVAGSTHQDGPSLLDQLTTKTFSVSSTIVRDKLKIILNEYYSPNQERAYIVGSGGFEEFYYDAGATGESFVTVYKQESHVCIQAYHDVFNEQTFGFKSPLFALFSMKFPDHATICDEDKLKHIIGPARLLLQIPLLFELEKSDNNDGLSGSIKYVGSRDNLIVSVYYHSSVGQEGKVDLMNSLPALVEVDWQKRQKQWPSKCTVAFNSLKFYHQSGAILEHDSDRTGYADLVTDKFMFPLARGCSKYLKPVEMNLNISTVTFQAEIDDFSRRFVAIDQVAQTYRVDDRSTSETGHSQMRIYDIKRDRNYLVVESEPSSECVSTKIGDKRQEMLAIHPAFGTNKFAYMGSSLVDGATVQVWEGTTNYLPFWLDLPELVQTESRGFVSRVHGQALQRSNEDIYSRQMFSIVIYLAVNDTSQHNQVNGWPNILLMQVYPFDLSRRKPNHLLHEIRLYQFVHELTDAPDNDRATNLFAPSSCFETDTSASVEMILEVPQGKDWLQETNKRDPAIRAALPLASTMINNFQSIIVHQNSLLMSLIVKFDLIEPLEEIHFLSFEGNFKFKQQQYPEDSPHAGSPMECLSLVKHSERILYDERRGVCILEPLQESLDIVDASETGSELFKMRHEKDTAMARSHTVAMQFFATSLDRLELIRVDYEQTKPDQVRAIVKQIKLTGADELDPASRNKSQIAFAGVNFDESRLEIKTRRVKAYDGSQLAHSGCQSACLQDSNCKSFSYCSSSSDGNICILSDVTIENANFQAQLSKLQVWKMAHKQRFQVDLGDGSKLPLLHESQCQIEMKVFSDFYIVPPMPVEGYDINLLQFNKTSTPNNCARLCLERNQQTIKLLNENNLKLNELIHRYEKEDINTKIEISIVREKKKQLEKQFCRKFMFLDGSISEEELNRLANLLNDEETPLGYCGFLKGYSDDKFPWEEAIYKFAPYKFDFSKLYSARSDVLLTSSLSKQERNAFSSLDDESHVAEDSLDVVKKVVAAGKNFQIHRGGLDLAECSKLCFSQPRVLGLACVSFDHSLDDHQDNCYLNTANWTSTDAIATNDSEYVGTNRVHYEPIFASVQLDTDFYQEVKSEEEQTTHGWQVALNVIVIMVGIICGCCLVGPRLEPRVAKLFKLNGRIEPDLASLASWQVNQSLNQMSTID